MFWNIVFSKKLSFNYYILLLKLSPFMILVDPVAKLKSEYIIPVVISMQNYLGLWSHKIPDTDPMDGTRIHFFNFFSSHNWI